MKANKTWPASLLMCGLFVVSITAPSFAQSNSKPSPKDLQPEALKDRDGQNDFDFNIGTWKTHIKRLRRPLANSTEWVESNGTVAVSEVWNGRANLEEIEMDGPNGHLEGLTLRLYNPESHQWFSHWANRNDSMLGPPMIGEFKNGQGEFYDQETFNGRAILVRQIFSNITANSYNFEQSFSDDGGKTWEPNWVATFSRESPGLTTSPQPVSEENRQGDFDFNLGRWKTHVTRLKNPLTGLTAWVEYDGTSFVRPVWNGRASLFELEVDGPAGHIEGVGLRLYNPESHQWSLNWANSADGAITKPMIGQFKNGRGEFFDQELFNGRAIFARNGFSDITPDSSRFEQAFSTDGGQTWETNWIMTFKKKDESRETKQGRQ